jgi:hypothetical protein
MAVQAPPPELPRGCPPRNAASLVPTPDAFAKAATASS